MTCSYFKSQGHRSARIFSSVVKIDDIPEWMSSVLTSLPDCWYDIPQDVWLIAGETTIRPWKSACSCRVWYRGTTFRLPQAETTCDPLVSEKFESRLFHAAENPVRQTGHLWTLADDNRLE